MENFTIPVVLDPAIEAKLNEILEAVKTNQEAIEELKKIKLGVGLITGTDLNEEDAE